MNSSNRLIADAVGCCSISEALSTDAGESFCGPWNTNNECFNICLLFFLFPVLTFVKLNLLCLLWKRNYNQIKTIFVWLCKSLELTNSKGSWKKGQKKWYFSYANIFSNPFIHKSFLPLPRIVCTRFMSTYRWTLLYFVEDYSLQTLDMWTMISHRWLLFYRMDEHEIDPLL